MKGIIEIKRGQYPTVIVDMIFPNIRVLKRNKSNTALCNPSNTMDQWELRAISYIPIVRDESCYLIPVIENEVSSDFIGNEPDESKVVKRLVIEAGKVQAKYIIPLVDFHDAFGLIPPTYKIV